jgi:hypothetical protein
VVCHGVLHRCRAKPSAFFSRCGSLLDRCRAKSPLAERGAGCVEEEGYVFGSVCGGDEGGLRPRRKRNDAQSMKWISSKNRMAF